MKAAEDRNNKLQELLSALTESLREAKKAADAVCAHSVEIYGVDPYDVDNEQFIESCDLRNEEPGGWTADDFDASMKGWMGDKE